MQTNAIGGAILIAPDVLSQEIGGETVLLDLKGEIYFGLDEIGTRVWQLIQEHADFEPVVSALLDEFEAEPAQLRADVGRLIEDLERAGLVTWARSDSGAT